MDALLTTIKNFDAILFRKVNMLADSIMLDQLMLLVSARWFWALTIVVVALILALFRKWTDLRRVLIAVAVMGCCDALTSYGLKENIERQRPCYALESVRLVQPKCGSQFGFPSNHAANGMAIATSMHLLFGRLPLSLLLGGLAVLVSYSRVHLGVHYPLDVASGMMFGAVVAASILLPLKKIRPAWFLTDHR